MTVERVGEVNERDMRENENKERGESDDEVDVPRRGWHVSPSPLSQRKRSLTRSYFTRRNLQFLRRHEVGRPNGLVVGYLLWVQGIPGSNPGWAPHFSPFNTYVR